jgi:hypothetical protein
MVVAAALEAPGLAGRVDVGPERARVAGGLAFEGAIVPTGQGEQGSKPLVL